MSPREPLTYAEAGVCLDAADATVDAIAGHVQRASRPEVVGGIGGFGGLFALDPGRWRDPLLVTSCDGVGTKLEVARQLGRYDTVGVDLVAMVVDDIVVSGAEPLVFNDYIAVEALEPDTVAAIVGGIADGCVTAGCALVGGETAEHPGVLPAGAFDLAGFGAGIVERSALLGPDRVRPGDAVLAMASSGLHSNGYSLARRALADHPLDTPLPRGSTVGEALLTPTRIYAPACLALIDAVDVHALCHVTGGGIPGNLPRVLPAGLGAVVDTATFPTSPLVQLIASAGPVESAELWRTFNMGAGMLAVVAHDAANAAAAVLADRGVPAWQCGAVVNRRGVQLT